MIHSGTKSELNTESIKISLNSLYYLGFYFIFIKSDAEMLKEFLGNAKR